MAEHQTTQESRPLIFIGNRWVNTVYTGYGIIKQRILLEIFQELQEDIKKVMNGKRVTDVLPPTGQTLTLNLDISKISHYNNYHNVRKQIKEMSERPIDIYMDPEFKKPVYIKDPLLKGFKLTDKPRMITVGIARNIAELLLHVDFSHTKKKAYQYTKLDRFTIAHSKSRYMQPLYTMICSYAEKAGFTIGTEELRSRLQVEEKYIGFDNFRRKILNLIKKELDIFGSYGFNYELKKEGKKVTEIVFKIYANKKYDYNHVWLKIHRALTEELPYFARFKPDQHEEFNYLLTGKYDLDKVLAKLHHIHKALVRKKESGEAITHAFSYTMKSIHEEFPPG